MKENRTQISAVITSYTLEALVGKYPLKITAEATINKAEIKISGALYNWSNSEVEITKKIDDFLAEGIKDVDVYINSPGGDVFVAGEIANQLKRFTGKKSGFGGALVASSASDLAISLDTFEMAENGQFMYHKPSAYLQGNDNVIESGLVLLKNLTEQYKARLSEKSGLTVDEIEGNWSKGDVWLTAGQALEQKFITGVIGKTAITPDTKAMFEACGSPIATRVNDYANRRENQEQNNDITEISAEQVTAVINNLITAKKILGNQIPFVSSLLKSDYKNTLAMFDLKPELVKVSSVIELGKASGRESWTLDDWRKKDPTALRKDPQLYAELVNAEYGK